MNKGTCKYCGKPVVWITTLKGRAMICEVELVDDMSLKAGDTIVTSYGHVIVVKAEMLGTSAMEGIGGYRPHWANCPGAEQARQRGPR